MRTTTSSTGTTSVAYSETVVSTGIYEDYRSGNSIVTNAREFHILNSMNAFSYAYGISQGGSASELSASSAEFFSGLFDWFKERVG